MSSSMSEKKRKDLPGGSEMPKKKSRKRAADYLDDEAEKTIPTTNGVHKDEKLDNVSDGPKIKKRKKSKTGKGETLTADGVNGVVEHPGKATVEPTPSSMQAEAQRTVDTEMKEDFGDDAPEDGDLGAALLAGFDSDTSDHAEDKGLDVNNLGSIPNYKKTKKKLSKVANKGDADTPGAIYIGRIPHGFFEPQMREYFSQFGDISRIRLSRNKRTGASKHFAFMEFKSEEVAKIVAETMDNYLMFGHILKCKFAPAETLHADVWKGANKKYRKIPHEKLEKAKLEAPKSVDMWRQKNENEEKKRNKKAKELKEKMGYDAPAVKLTDPSKAIKTNKLKAAKPKEIEDIVAEEVTTMAAIEAPSEALIEVKATATVIEEPVKKEKKSKKEKKAKVEEESKEEKPTKKEKKGKPIDTEKVAEDKPTEKASKKEKKGKPVDTVKVIEDKPAEQPSKKEKTEKKSKMEKLVGIENVVEEKPAEKPAEKKSVEKPAGKPVAALANPKSEAAEQRAPKLQELAGVEEEGWEDDDDSSAASDADSDSDADAKSALTKVKPTAEAKPQAKAPASGDLPVFKNPKIPKDATGKQIHRDSKGKYIPPLQLKQLARAKFAKENPEAQKAMKNAKLSERKQKRFDKKEKRHQKMIEKFGEKNVKGGANYKSAQKAKKANKKVKKVGGRNE